MDLFTGDEENLLGPLLQTRRAERGLGASVRTSLRGD
jgi:hypothetical protein